MYLDSAELFIILYKCIWKADILINNAINSSQLDQTFLRWTKMWAKTIPLCHSRFYEMLYLSITTNYARVRWEELIGICIWIGRVDCTSLCVKPEESVGMFIPLLLYASNYFACTSDKCLSITELKKNSNSRKNLLDCLSKNCNSLLT